MPNLGGVLISVSPTEPEDLEGLCGLEPLSEDLSGTFLLYRLPLMGFSRGFLRLWQMLPPKNFSRVWFLEGYSSLGDISSTELK